MVPNYRELRQLRQSAIRWDKTWANTFMLRLNNCPAQSYKMYSVSSPSFLARCPRLYEFYSYGARSPNLGIEKAPAIHLDATGAALYRINITYWALACTIRLISTSSPKMPATSVHVLPPYRTGQAPSSQPCQPAPFLTRGWCPFPIRLPAAQWILSQRAWRSRPLPR